MEEEHKEPSLGAMDLDSGSLLTLRSLTPEEELNMQPDVADVIASAAKKKKKSV